MNHDKIFLAAPFKGLIDPKTGAFCPHMRNHLESICSYLTQQGYEVYNSHRREDWGKAFMSPEECTYTDFNDIINSKFFLAFPGSPPSPGTHIELGWASALKKPMLLFLEKNKDYAYLVKGLHTIADVSYCYYEHAADSSTIIQELTNFLAIGNTMESKI